jgi:hypothetical protein
METELNCLTTNSMSSSSVLFSFSLTRNCLFLNPPSVDGLSIFSSNVQDLLVRAVCASSSLWYSLCRPQVLQPVISNESNDYLQSICDRWIVIMDGTTTCSIHMRVECKLRRQLLLCILFTISPLRRATAPNKPLIITSWGFKPRAPFLWPGACLDTE